MKKNYLKKLNSLLEEKGVKISVLAKAIGKNPNTITNYLKGSTKIDVDTLKQIADYFGVPVSYFFGESAGGSAPMDDQCRRLLAEKDARIAELKEIVELLKQICTERKK